MITDDDEMITNVDVMVTDDNVMITNVVKKTRRLLPIFPGASLA